jgi:hypothetical protein
MKRYARDPGLNMREIVHDFVPDSRLVTSIRCPNATEKTPMVTRGGRRGTGEILASGGA